MEVLTLKKWAILVLVVTFSLTGLFSATLTVGASNYTEQYIFGEIISALLEENGFRVDKRFGLNTLVKRTGMLNGQIDVTADYTGTAWTTYYHKEELIYDPTELYNQVKNMDKEQGLVWLDLTSINNSYALAMTRERAESLGIDTISDLAEYVNNNPRELKIAIDYEFFEGAMNIFEMAEAYNMNISKNDVKTMQWGLTYEAVNQGDADITMVFTTDSQLLKYDLKVLEDDKHFFPFYHVAVVMREDTLEKYPEIAEILRPFAMYLNQDIVIRLNYLVDVEGKEPEEVAKNYLKGLGLIE
ncbi:MAG: Substrate-binding region of ABC-type glycine betaine transport system [Petrotoga mobilis]|nr:MAG: Substrate-binding region of ABC-type glycine betaine transport system [Petrotoga mobilis]